MIELKIDPEFRDKIPPLTDAEYEQLKENILAAGEIYEPIVTWNGIIVDGNNRYKIICANPSIKWRTREMKFADKWEAFEWMYKNQLGRRNLTDEQRTYMIGKMYEARKNTQGGDRKSEKSKSQNATLKSVGRTPRTDELIGEELGVNHATVHRAYKFAQGVDAIRESSKEAADKIMSGGSYITKKEVKEFPTKAPEEQSKFISDVISGAKRSERSAQKPDEVNRAADRERRALNKRLNAISEDMAKMKPRAYTKKDLLDELKVLRNEFVGKVRQTLKERRKLIGDGDEVYEALVSCEREIQKIEEEFIK